MPPARASAEVLTLAIAETPRPSPKVERVPESRVSGARSPARRKPARRVAAPVLPIQPQGEMAVPPPRPPAPPGDEGGPGDELSGGGFGGGLGFGGGSDRRRPELAGRVIGGRLRGPALAEERGLPSLSLREATALRTHDHFPRLPAALWTHHRPYMVGLEVCVSAEGRVSEVALRSAASPQLDRMVLQAVHTWRYQPRVVDGVAQPFCHAVIIKYERAF